MKKVWVLDSSELNAETGGDADQALADLWTINELGNDTSYLSSSILELLEHEPQEFKEVSSWTPLEYETRTTDMAPLVEYLRKQGVADDEEVLLHYWW